MPDDLIIESLKSLDATKTGIATTALNDAEITDKVPRATDEEVTTFFESNKEKLQGDLAKWQEQIRTYLTGQRVTTRRQAFLKQLRETADVKVFLKAPPVFRATVSTAGAPFRGPETAPVTIVEFSDFHCPFCRQVQPILAQLLSRYKD